MSHIQDFHEDRQNLCRRIGLTAQWAVSGSNPVPALHKQVDRVAMCTGGHVMVGMRLKIRFRKGAV